MHVDKKFSLLFMRDHGHVRRVRLGMRILIGFITLFCIILPLIAGLSAWLAYEKWQESALLKDSNQMLEQKYIQANAKAERLANLEELLNKLNPVEAEKIIQNLAAIKAVKTGPAPTTAPTDAEINAEQVGSEELNTTGKGVPTINSGHINIEKVVARLAANRKLRISFDLHNLDQKKTISGKVNCTFLTADGQSLPLVITQEMSDFKITRFKRAAIVAQIPDGASVTNAAVVIEITLEGDIVAYRNIFPILR